MVRQVNITVQGRVAGFEALNRIPADLNAIRASAGKGAILNLGLNPNDAKNMQLLNSQVADGTVAIKAVNEQWDIYSNTIRRTIQVTKSFEDADTVLNTTLEVSVGNIQKLIAASQKIAGINADEASSVNALERSYRGLIATEERAAAVATATPKARIAAANANVAAAEQNLALAQSNRVPAGQGFGVSGQFISNDVRSANIAQAEAELAAAVKTQRGVYASNTGLINKATASQVAATNALKAAQESQIAATRAAAAANLKVAEAEEFQAHNAPIFTTPALATILTQSPSSARALAQAGVGTGPPGSTLAQNLARQGVLDPNSIQIEKDLEHNVTNVSAAFRDQNGVLSKLNLTYDEGGNLISKFGSRLSGTRSLLTQIGRDFQKVAEFALATTVVFGAFQVATQSIGAINTLDAGVKRFGITAQLSQAQSKSFFNQLATVAFNTATPLDEIVNSADDIALATKKANQTSEQWQQSILSLTGAVGIYTNLTGTDTVKATDLLTSTMKQLGIQADQVVGVLNKITAVAGGQSQAIDDITTAVSNLASLGPDAKLTLDQLIGISQALSQATPKTPDQIATSVKNLVGSLTSASAVKAFKEFGIQGVDAGKNIIDIYTQVEDKIKSGVIPTNQVQTFIKDISGGPRRAPDAAALLDNINAVNAATKKSQDATNEAVIANAKLLDTTSAKITQLGVLFNQFAFNKFAASLNEAAGDAAGALTVLINVLNAIPVGTVKAVIELTALLVGLKALLAVGKGVVGIFNDIKGALGIVSGQSQIASKAFQQQNAAYLTETAAARDSLAVTASGVEATGGLTKATVDATGAINLETESLAANTKAKLDNTVATEGASAANGGLAVSSEAGALANGSSGLSGLLGKISKSGLAKGGLVGAGVGIGAGLLTGDIGTGLISGGVAASLAGAPEIGVPLALVGVLASLVQGDKDATTAQKANIEETLTAIQSYKDASSSLSDLNTNQVQLTAKLIADTKAKGANKVATSDLNAEVDALSQNYSNLTAAQQAQAAAFEVIKKNYPDVAAQFANQAALAQAGALGTDALSKLSQKLTVDLYNATNNTNIPPDTKLPTFAQLAKTVAPTNGAYGTNAYVQGPPQFTSGRNPAYIGPGAISQIDLTKLGGPGSGNDVTKLFDTFGSTLQAHLSLTKDNIARIKAALDALPEGDQKNTLEKTFAAAADQADLLAQAIDNIGLQKSTLDALQIAGVLSVNQHDTGQANLGAYQTLLNGVSQLPQGQQSAAGNSINSLFLQQGGQNSGLIRTDALGLQDAASLDKIIRTQDAGAISLLKFGQQEEFVKNQAALMGISIQGWNDQEIKAIQNTQDLQAALDNLAAAGEQQDANFAQREQNLVAQLNSGAFKGHLGAFQALQNQSIEIHKSFDNLDSFLQGISTSGGLNDYETALSRIIGLEDVVGKQPGDLANEILSYGEAAGLSGKQIDVLISQMIGLGAVIEGLPSIKQITVEITTLQDQIALTNPGGPDDRGPIQALNKQLADLQKKKQDAETKAAESYIKSITKTLLSGKGSNFGSTAAGNAAAGPSVSLLDIPSPLNSQSNEASLLAQAVKNATKLRNEIPGETKKDKNDIVELLDGTKKVLEVRGISEELLTKALNELNDTVKAATATTADTIKRIRVGGGDFSAIANVPLNSKTGISLGGANGPINVTLNLNGTVLTPAQFSQFADQIAAAISRQLASGG